MAKTLNAGKAVIEFALNTKNAVNSLGKFSGTVARKVNVPLAKMATLAAGAATAIGSIGAAAVGFAAKLAIDLEKATAGMTAFTGSAETARKTIAAIEQFAATAPVDVEAVQAATNKLISYGMSAEDAVKTAKALTVVTEGNSENLNSAALAMGQVWGQQKLMGQEARQLIEANAKPWVVLSEKMGVTTGKLREMMEQGKISGADLANAFVEATQEGGKFGELMPLMANTVSGSWKLLTTNFKLAIRPLGEALLPHMKSMLDTLMGLMPAMKGFVGELVEAIKGWGSLSEIMAKVIPDFEQFRMNLQGIADAFAAGEIVLGAKIAFLTLSNTILKATQDWRAIWTNVLDYFHDGWVTAFTGIAKFGLGIFNVLKTALMTLVGFVRTAVGTFVQNLAAVMAKIPRMGGKAEALRKVGVEIAGEGGFAAMKKGIEEGLEQEKALEQMAAERRKGGQFDYGEDDARLEANQKAIDLLREEAAMRRAIVEEEAKARQEAFADANDEIEQQGGGAADGAKGGAGRSATGLFGVRYAAQQFGARNFMRLQQEIADNTRKMADRNTTGGLPVV